MSDFLQHFITEDIYIVDSRESRANEAVKPKYLVVTALPISDTDNAFLLKIFEAVNITPDQLELSKSGAKLKDNHVMVFFFGNRPAGITFEPYVQFKWDGHQAVIAHSLSEIATDNVKKKALWTLLKACFP